jgi:hypothetical protein
MIHCEVEGLLFYFSDRHQHLNKALLDSISAIINEKYNIVGIKDTYLIFISMI